MEFRKDAGAAIFMNCMTNHARTRCQQRAIPSLVVDLLLAYGEEQHDHRGAVMRYFDKRAKQSIKRQAGSLFLRHFSEYLKCYLVESASDGEVITVGYINGRIKHTNSN